MKFLLLFAVLGYATSNGNPEYYLQLQDEEINSRPPQHPTHFICYPVYDHDVGYKEGAYYSTSNTRSSRYPKYNERQFYGNDDYSSPPPLPSLPRRYPAYHENEGYFVGGANQTSHGRHRRPHGSSYQVYEYHTSQLPTTSKYHSAFPKDREYNPQVYPSKSPSSHYPTCHAERHRNYGHRDGNHYSRRHHSANPGRTFHSSCKPLEHKEDYSCPATYDPVCGSNGKTYDNTCELGRYVKRSGERVFVASHGPCGSASHCPVHHDPVCASDGRTYNNECQLNEYCKRTGKYLYAVHHGGCNEGRCNCPKIYDPVCGSDGQTYNNLCELNCWNRLSKEGVYVVRPGACEVGCHCPKVGKPVCASNGHTFNGACELDCYNRRTGKNLYIAHDGECEGCNCGLVYHPVCASNNKTYANLCEMLCHGNKTNTQLMPKWNGTCADGPCKCSSSGTPVCASDRNTYSSQCELDCHNRYRTHHNKLLAVFNGTCAERNCYWRHGTNCSGSG